MECITCGKEFEPRKKLHQFCSRKCADAKDYELNKEKKKKQSLEYYYQNRTKVLAYQKKRWKEKYEKDSTFREKRALRDKSRQNGHGRNEKIHGACIECGTTIDLHRHHPSYQSSEFIVMCRKCHNLLHEQIKTREEREKALSTAVA